MDRAMTAYAAKQAALAYGAAMQDAGKVPVAEVDRYRDASTAALQRLEELLGLLDELSQA